MKKESRWYADGVERTKINGEVFTPEKTADNMLDLLVAHDPVLLSGTFLDPSCGDGNLLICVLKRKIKGGINAITALESIFGIELMEDNAARCRQRLAECAARHLYLDGDDYQTILGICLNIVNSVPDSSYSHIVCHDTMTWDVEHWRPIGSFGTEFFTIDELSSG